MQARAFVHRSIPEDWFLEKKSKKYTASVLLKVPKEEYKRILEEKNIKVSIDILFYYEDYDNKMQILNEGDVISSGNGFAVYVKPSDTCYVYIYQVDALGKSFRLFPNKDYNTKSNPLSMGTECWIPNEKEVFELDDTTGKERIYVFASSDKIKEFEGEKTISLLKSDIDSVVKFKKMGIARVRNKVSQDKINPPKQSKKVAEVKNKLQAEGAFVYETWFYHK